MLKTVDHIGQEFFRFEMATAVAGAVLGINPFNQPDVEAAKIETRELTSAFEKTGKLPDEKPRDFEQRRRDLRRQRERQALRKGAPTATRDHGSGRTSRDQGQRLRRPARLH